MATTVESEAGGNESIACVVNRATVSGSNEQ